MPVFDPLLPWPLIAALALLCIVQCLVSTWRSPKPAAARAALPFRLGWICVAALLLLRPSLDRSEQLTEKDLLYLLRDRSASMQLRDMPERKSRDTVAAKLLKDNAERLTALRDRYELVELDFAASPAAAGTPVADGATALGNALLEAAASPSLRRNAGVIHLGDAASNTGATLSRAAAACAGRKIPVHTVLLGRNDYGEGLEDAAVIEIEAPSVVQKDDPLAISVSYSLRGMKDRPVTLRILCDGREVATRELLSKRSIDSALVHLEVPGKDLGPGFHSLSAVITPGPQELSSVNNQADTFFRVRGGGLKILLLATSPSPEFKFIRRALEACDAFECIVPSPYACRSAEGQKEVLALATGPLDAAILVDPDPELVPTAVLDTLLKLPQNRRAGLMLVLGPRSAPLLAQIPGAPASVDGAALEVSSPMSPAGQGASHFISAPLARLAQADPLSWKARQNQSRRIIPLKLAPGAKSLLEIDGHSVLVADNLGKGRLVILAGPLTWPLAMDAVSRSGIHDPLWRRSVCHLAFREDLLDGLLSLELDRSRIELGDKVSLRSSLESNSGSQAPKDAKVLWRRLESPPSKGSLVLSADGDSAKASFSPQEGTWSLVAEAMVDGKLLHSNEQRLQVRRPRAEIDQPLADSDAAEALARSSGGSVIAPGDFSALLDRYLQAPAQRSTRSVKRLKSLWDNWFFYLLGLGLLGTEWYIRRKGGLP